MKAATCDIDGSNIREVTDSPALFPNTRRYKVVTPGNKGTLDVLVVDAKHAGAPMDWLVAGMDSVDSEVCPSRLFSISISTSIYFHYFSSIINYTRKRGREGVV